MYLEYMRVRCRNYHCGPFQERRPFRISRARCALELVTDDGEYRDVAINMEGWLFSLP